jgi:hypothetical protein
MTMQVTARVAIVEACARAAHEANRAYCMTLGDFSHLSWDNSPEEMRASTRNGVEKALAGATSEELHESWCADKRAAGWVCGLTKNAAAKTHPCLVPYSELPEEHRRKDALYASVVRAMAKALGA